MGREREKEEEREAKKKKENGEEKKGNCIRGRGELKMEGEGNFYGGKIGKWEIF